MITLGINEFIRNIRRNILVITQMIAIYIIAIFIISAFEEQYTLYDGMSNVLDDTGILMHHQAMDTTDNIVTYDSLVTTLNKVENIAIKYEHNVYSNSYNHGNTTGILDMSIIANDPSLITYKPRLLEGSWCEDSTHKDGMINIVISNNSIFDFKVGDVINIDDISYNITGIYSCDELIFGYGNRSKGFDTNYLHFYYSLADTYNEQGYAPCLAIASYSDMQREINPWRVAFGNILIDFEDDITEEEYNENIALLKQHYGHVENRDVYSSKIIYDNTMAHLEMKLLPMFVLLAIIIFVLIVSMLTASAINILYEKRNYGIYFICGNDWKKTFVISTIHWFTVSIISIIIAISGCMLIKSFGNANQLTLTFTSTHVWTILAITAVSLIAALILPYNMLRKIQPISILKENND